MNQQKGAKIMKPYLYILALFLLIPGVCFSQSMVYSLAIDRTKDGSVYTSTYCGGMWKADEGLASWSAQNNGLNVPLPIAFHTILCAAIAPSNGSIMYCGNTEGYVYRSNNRGDTWFDTGLNLHKMIRGLAIDPTNPDHVYAASELGLYEQKKDIGWKTVLPEEYGIFEDVAFDLFDSKTIYTVTQNFKGTGSIQISHDSGVTWAETKLSYGIVRIGLDPVHEGTLYLATRGSILKTTDYGINWEFLNTGLPKALVTAIAIDPMDAQIVYAGTMDGLYVSGDGGTNFANTDLVEGMVTNLAFSRGEDSLFIGTARYALIKQELSE